MQELTDWSWASLFLIPALTALLFNLRINAHYQAEPLLINALSLYQKSEQSIASCRSQFYVIQILLLPSNTIVYIGAEFWERITGDAQFYYRLAKAFGEVVEEDGIDGSLLVKEKISEIAAEIRNKGGL